MQWRALAAFGIFVAGAAVALATASAVGWRDSDADSQVATTQPVSRTYTLRDGDVAVRPEAATRCEASAEGGIPNLFCTRIPVEGRHQVIFYSDCVLVWPLPLRGVEGTPVHYAWEPKRGCR